MSLFGVFRADLEEALVRWAARAPPRPATYPPRSPQPLPPATAQNLCTGPPTNARRSSGTSMLPSWTGSMPSGQWAVDFSTPPLRRCPLDIFRGGGCRVGIGGAGEGGKGSTPHAQQRPPPAAHKIRHHVGCQYRPVPNCMGVARAGGQVEYENGGSGVMGVGKAAHATAQDSGYKPPLPTPPATLSLRTRATMVVPLPPSGDPPRERQKCSRVGAPATRSRLRAVTPRRGCPARLLERRRCVRLGRAHAHGRGAGRPPSRPRPTKKQKTPSPPAAQPPRRIPHLHPPPPNYDPWDRRFFFCLSFLYRAQTR